MKISLQVELAGFQSAVREWAAKTNRSQQQVLAAAARLVISNPRQGSGLLQITPPSSAGVTGAAARRQGEASIDRDLRNIFSPVEIKGKRNVPAPAPGPIHQRHWALKRPGRPLRRDRAQPYFVDVRRYAAMRRELIRRVGYLASGWLASARALGAAVPAWVARHGVGRGTIRIQFSAPRYGIEMVCFAPVRSPWQELQRRVPYAIRYATNNLHRQIAHQCGKDARAVGLQVKG